MVRHQSLCGEVGERPFLPTFFLEYLGKQIQFPSAVQCVATVEAIDQSLMLGPGHEERIVDGGAMLVLPIWARADFGRRHFPTLNFPSKRQTFV